MKLEDIKVGEMYYVQPHGDVYEAEVAGAKGCWAVVKYNWGSLGLCHLERVLCPVPPSPPSVWKRFWSGLGKWWAT